ncbi:hypothetical protein LTR85_001231 [Meristemomyces frigidus]|nr:hypothetical protein LTR85_001231 [Meristemomyces frigidus]
MVPIDESDPLLDDTRPAQYGSIGTEDDAQPDEEELRREREVLERITAEAADNMIDVSHPSSSDLSHHIAHTSHDRQTNQDHRQHTGQQDTAEPEDADEAAWLQSLQSDGLDSVSGVEGLRSGALVMDISQLRQDAPPSSVKKALKAAIR